MSAGRWIIVGSVVLTCTAMAAPVRAAPARPNLRALFNQAVAEFDEAQNLQSKHPDRARSLFRSAAQRFQSLIAAGVVNGRLEFNLANSYLQAGDVGRAILHYRRAQRLIPTDPMLEDNLSVARSRCLTTIRPTRRSEVLKYLFFWHYQTSQVARTKAAIVFYLLVWVILIVRSLGFGARPLSRSPLPRRVLTVAACTCAALAALAGGSVATSRWVDRNAPGGVITAMDVVVQKGPGEGYQRQFAQPLQPGVEFTLRQRTPGGWWKIELPDEQSGWIEASQAELIAGSTKL